MRILITGSGGFVGSRLVSYYQNIHEIIAARREDMDITNENDVIRYLGIEHPDVVIHCAALSNTGYCQEHEEESLAVNLKATVNIAKACAKIGCKLVYMSSDQVYNAITHKSACTESEELPEPLNVYGRHKLEAERKVSQILPSAVGLRLTWMYDQPESKMRLNSNILVNISNAFKESRKLKASTNELRGMTDVWEVVRNMEKVISLPGGIYNYGCDNYVNSYETFRAAADSLEIAPDKVIEKDENFHRNLSMDISLIKSYSIEFPSTIVGFNKAR